MRFSFQLQVEIFDHRIESTHFERNFKYRGLSESYDIRCFVDDILNVSISWPIRVDYHFPSWDCTPCIRASKSTQVIFSPDEKHYILQNDFAVKSLCNIHCVQCRRMGWYSSNEILEGWLVAQLFTS